MASNNDKINIYDINSLLFKLISLMSEAERRKLQGILISKLYDAGNGKDLSTLITSLSEAKRYELLRRLINWYHAKKSRLRGHSSSLELRAYPRKPYSIPVELSRNGFTFMCFTQNISKSGVFIQTDFRFHVNQQITMLLSPPDIDTDIAVGGEIVRIDSKGIGVKFNELLRGI